MDYTANEIIIKNQTEFDAIPLDYRGKIIINFGAPGNRAVVNRKFEHALVMAWGNSSVEAWDNSSVVARGNSSVVARGNSSVEARDNSSVVARGNSSVEAWDNSSVEAWDNSSVVARGYAQACIYSAKEVTAHEKARTIYPNKDIKTFMALRSIKHTKTRSIWYKAVHKGGDAYTADWDKSFVYELGKVYEVKADPDTNRECGRGINMASLHWALTYGRQWRDLAILEVETNTEDIILPKHSDGKVRTSRVKVLREVPLEECGLYGKILAKKMGGVHV